MVICKWAGWALAVQDVHIVRINEDSIRCVPKEQYCWKVGENMNCLVCSFGIHRLVVCGTYRVIHSIFKRRSRTLSGTKDVMNFVIRWTFLYQQDSGNEKWFLLCKSFNFGRIFESYFYYYQLYKGFVNFSSTIYVVNQKNINNDDVFMGRTRWELECMGRDRDNRFETATYATNKFMTGIRPTIVEVWIFIRFISIFDFLSMKIQFAYGFKKYQNKLQILLCLYISILVVVCGSDFI